MPSKPKRATSRKRSTSRKKAVAFRPKSALKKAISVRSYKPASTYKKSTYKKSMHPHHIHSIYDATTQNSASDALATPMAVGSFVPITSVARTTIASDPSARIYIVSQFSNCNLQLFSINGTTGAVTAFNLPQLFSASPLAIRALKMTLEITNTTVFTGIQGSCRALSANQMVNWQWSSTTSTILSGSCLLSLNNLMDSHPDVKTYSAMHFAKDSSFFIVPPASHVSFAEYYDFYGYLTNSVSNVQNALSMNNPNDVSGYGPPPPVQNIVIFEINPTSSSNTYDIVLKTQTACRFDLSNYISNLSLAPKFKDSTTFEKEVALLQSTASEAIPAGSLQQAHAMRSGKNSKFTSLIS